MKKLMMIMVTVVMMMTMTVSVMAGEETLLREDFNEIVDEMREEYEEERDLYEGFIKDSNVKGKFVDEDNYNIRVDITIYNDTVYSCDMRCYNGNVNYITYLNGVCLPVGYVNDYYWSKLEQFENDRR